MTCVFAFDMVNICLFAQNSAHLVLVGHIIFILTRLKVFVTSQRSYPAKALLLPSGYSYDMCLEPDNQIPPLLATPRQVLLSILTFDHFLLSFHPRVDIMRYGRSLKNAGVRKLISRIRSFTGRVLN